jgi:CheY-like chemotaxis protein
MPTLLLADDSVTIQRVIELTFADEGIRVIAVGDGETAIKRIDEERPDIVLADVGMPGVDGYQVASHVKQSAGSPDARVLLLTGAFEPIDEQRARDTGCDGVLVKPFEPRQLIKTVKDLLAGDRSGDLWPADMPRTESSPPRPVASPPPMPAPTPAPAPVVPYTPPVVPASAAERAPESEPAVSDDGTHVLSVPYGADGDADLVDALARLEFVGVPDPPVPAPAEPPRHDVTDAPAGSKASSLEWDLSAGPASAGGARPVPPPANQSLANVFSALLAAERQHPNPLASATSSPALSEAAVEEVVQKVVRRMTDELVRKIVLETAERLIREEIARIKA